MKIGYMRISTQIQDLALQQNALQAAGCERIFQDKLSGSKEDRPGLLAAMKVLKPGDTLIVWKLDRLGRSTLHLIETIMELNENKIFFQSITESWDTSTAHGMFVFTIMAATAQYERDMIRMRVRAGLEAAKAKGTKLGRRHTIPEESIVRAVEMRAAGATYDVIGAELKMSRASVHRVVKERMTDHVAP